MLMMVEWCRMRSSQAAVSVPSPAKALSQLPKVSQIRSEDHRTALVTAGDDLKEEIGLLAAHRQIADLVHDQSFATADGVVHDLAIAPSALHRLNIDTRSAALKKRVL
jgi:hypothetical protein